MGSYITKKALYIAAAAIVAAVLYAASLKSYLLFHSIAELFSIVIAAGIFIIAWNTRRFLPNAYLLFIGIAYLYIAFIDLLHTLAYKGMGVFPGSGADLPTQFWIAGRSMEAVSLFAALFFLGKRLRDVPVVVAYFFATVLLLLSIYFGIFPDCFVEGRGLTTFKVASEYMISCILAAAILYIFKKKEFFEKKVFNLLVWSMVVTIASEMSFTLYRDVYGFFNLIGHYLKIVSFYLVYRALIRTNLQKPYESLVHEIEERKNAEEELITSEARFRVIFEHSTVGKCLTGLDGTLLKTNKAFADILGYTVEELEKRNFAEITYPEDVEEGLECIRLLKIEERVSCRFEKRYVHKSGSIVWADVSATMLHDEKGSPLYLIASVSDITERKREEAELKDSKALFEAVVENVPLMIFLKDSIDLRFVMFNRAGEELLGYARRELIGKSDYDFFPPEQAAYFIARDREVLDGKIGLLEIPEETILSAGKGNRILHTRKTCIRDASGNAKFLLGISEDITRRKQAERENAFLQAQLQQAQKMDAIGTLAGGIAHDFNNILAAIIGYTELAMDEEDKEIQHRHLQESLKGAERAKDLVRQILTFSRQGSNEKKPLDSRTLLDEAVKFLRASIPSTIEIHQFFSDEPCTMMADPVQMHQVIMNLSTNATYAMKPNGGILTIEMSPVELSRGEIPRYPALKPGPYVRIAVSDTGCGIDPANIERIFEPFFTTKPKNEGTGLGLSVVYGIVKNHDGVINVYSETGKGTRFNIYIPRIMSESIKENVSPEKCVGGTERILFVDDEPALVEITQSMLSLLGYHVTGVTSALEAAELFRDDPAGFDLVVTDMTLPKMTGIDLAREILRIRPGIPIILCSGIRESETEEQVRSLGISAYCTKPLTRKNLAIQVRKALDGCVKATSEELKE